MNATFVEDPDTFGRTLECSKVPYRHRPNPVLLARKRSAVSLFRYFVLMSFLGSSFSSSSRLFFFFFLFPCMSHHTSSACICGGACQGVGMHCLQTACSHMI